MKEVKNYHGEPIMAYQDADLDKLATVIAHAAMLWHAEWKKQGGEDKGTCCGGKGIKVPYIGPRKRNYEYKNIIDCSWVQGNLSAQASVAPALEFLKEQGIEAATYNDGWMD